MNTDIGFEGGRRNLKSWYALHFVSVGNKSWGYTGNEDTSLS